MLLFPLIPIMAPVVIMGNLTTLHLHTDTVTIGPDRTTVTMEDMVTTKEEATMGEEDMVIVVVTHTVAEGVIEGR